MLVNTYTYTHAITMYTNRKRIVYFRQTRQKKKENEREKSIRFMKRGFYAKSNPKSATAYSRILYARTLSWRYAHSTIQFAIRITVAATVTAVATDGLTAAVA